MARLLILASLLCAGASCGGESPTPFGGVPSVSNTSGSGGSGGTVVGGGGQTAMAGTAGGAVTAGVGGGGGITTTAGAGGELAAGDGGAQVTGGTNAGTGAAPAEGGAGGSPCAEPCVYYADGDGDGFGDPEVTMELCGECAVPDGYSSNADDCYDGNALANPDNPLPYEHEEDRGDGSWDYNCDGEETLLWTNLGSCPDLTEPVTPGQTGWWNGGVPNCGDEGEWKSNAASCPGVIFDIIQKCK